eukprot:CAMPEP_0170593382 /NCGR_PEP_ID=MMETSP0224-20130122/13417_1 /TAXON_ID=285029 /ORGANISM="Togula jolla, Strain CCCM 725" /LENGTH=147 /DNA_ID=CAMNT_0010917329 /DNA_START=39 /DNA_END=479 /DNA_ORIENTATION=+
MTRSDVVQFSRGFLLGISAFVVLVLCTYAPSAFIAPPANGNQQNLRSSSSIVEQTVIADSPQASSAASSVFGACSVISLVALATVGLKRRAKGNSVALARSLPTVVAQPSSVARRALDQSSRYADLSLTEEGLIKNGKHVLVAYIMK